MTEDLENTKNENNTCDCGKKLIIASIVSNSIVALLLAATLIVLVFGIVIPQAGGLDLPPNIAGHHQKGHKFKGKTIPYEEAMRDKKYAAVLFYADWCPHCQNFSPKFEKLSKNRKLGKKFNFVRINADSAEAANLMQEYQVKAFPSLFLVNPKDNEAYFINNSLFSDDDAIDILKEIFETYANSRDKKISD